MGKVIFNMSVSLDGFVAGPNVSQEQSMGEGGMRLFAWYNSGDTEVPLPGTDMVFKVSRASAALFDEIWPTLGAGITGRQNFNMANAWGGHPPGGVPLFVLTHNVPQEWAGEGSLFTFVTDGIERAVELAKEAAGDKNVGVSTASTMQQCLKAGLLDEIHIDQVPVLLGAGIRLFDNLGTTPIALEPIHVIEGQGVTHLGFRVIK